MLCHLLEGFLNEDFSRTMAIPESTTLWQEVDGIARLNDMIPLVYWASKKTGHLGRIPPSIASQWEQAYYHNARRNTLIFSELKEIIRRFNQESIEHLLIKGALLAPTIYRNMALRSMHDADIMINEASIDKALFILESSGYSLYGDEDERERHRRLGRTVLHRAVAEEDLFLEIHTKLLWSSFFIPVERMWRDRGEVKLSGFVAAEPAPHMHVLFLIVHWINHWRERDSLIWPFDIALFIQRRPPDWPNLIGEAETLEIKNALMYCLAFGREHFGLALPEEVIKDLSFRGINKIFCELLERNRFLFSFYLLNPGRVLFPTREFLKALYPENALTGNSGTGHLRYWKDCYTRAVKVRRERLRRETK
jgi:hypothetical protein